MLLVRALLLALLGIGAHAEENAPSPGDLKTVGVQVVSDTNPYETPVAVGAVLVGGSIGEREKLFSGEVAATLDTLVGELARLGIFRRAIPYRTGYPRHPNPALEVRMFGGVYGRDHPGATKGFGSGGGAKRNGQEESSRRRWGPGLETRFEVKDLESGEVLVKWYSFCNATFNERRELASLREPLIEEALVAKIRHLYDHYHEIKKIKDAKPK